MQVTYQRFLLSTCVHAGRTNITVTHIFFLYTNISSTALFQTFQIHRLKNFFFFKFENASRLALLEKCIHVKRFMITVMKPHSFLNDSDSVLQERVHFHSSTTNQRQSMLHTTNFRYAVLKPFSKITFVFKVHHLKRGV